MDLRVQEYDTEDQDHRFYSVRCSTVLFYNNSNPATIIIANNNKATAAKWNRSDK